MLVPTIKNGSGCILFLSDKAKPLKRTKVIPFLISLPLRQHELGNIFFYRPSSLKIYQIPWPYEKYRFR